jgi:hypothetical protein
MERKETGLEKGGGKEGRGKKKETTKSQIFQVICIFIHFFFLVAGF